MTRTRASALVAILTLATAAGALAGQSAADAGMPELTAPVHDLARVLDSGSATEIDRISRVLEAASGDVLVVVTVPTVAPYADIEEYAVKLFENHGRGIGARNNDNGVLLLVAVQERRVRIEVGYGLEQWITDGYAGETIRDVMTPEFRAGRYGAGLVAGAARIAGRIAQSRGVQLEGVEIPQERQAPIVEVPISTLVFVGLFLLFVYLNRNSGGPPRGVRRWGDNGWSGWSSGVGGFGGGFAGGRSGGGFGGGFGGFGGGRSGGGGASGGW